MKVNKSPQKEVLTILGSLVVDVQDHGVYMGHQELDSGLSSLGGNLAVGVDLVYVSVDLHRLHDGELRRLNVY